MNHVFLDLEMHPINKKYRYERSICSREIIEIGAVMLNHNNQEIADYKAFVKPDYSDSVSTYIYDLTGISSGDLFFADKLDVALTKFLSWCESYGEDYIIHAWSASDLEQIQNEMKLKGITSSPILMKAFSAWNDFQCDFENLIEVEEHISLENALASIGVVFSGRKHDALWDSRNTAKLYKAAQNPEDIKNILDYIDKILKTESDQSTLGDLFNFSKLELASA